MLWILIIISISIQPTVETHHAPYVVNSALEIEPLHVRITDIEWNLTTLYKEYEALNMSIHLTIVSFKVEVEIWNIGDKNQTLEFGSSDEFPLQIIPELENTSLILSPFWASLTVITPRSYLLGITDQTHEYPFSLNEPYKIRLPNGFYRMNLGTPILPPSGESVITYGLNLTVTNTDYSIEYDPFPYEKLTGDAELTYVLSECNNGYDLPGWEDGKVNITVENQIMYFDQIFITWCNFNEQNLTIEFVQVGNILQIKEEYSTLLITDCLCAHQISGKVTNLSTGNYTLIFQYETTVSGETDQRFTSTLNVGLGENQLLVETGIAIGFETIPVILGSFLLVKINRKREK